MADLPAGVVGGCGPNLNRLVLTLHFQGQREIVLRQREGMDHSDCGIADMKIGREPSSLLRRRAEGFEGPETTTYIDNDGA